MNLFKLNAALILFAAFSSTVYGAGMWLSKGKTKVPLQAPEQLGEAKSSDAMNRSIPSGAEIEFIIKPVPQNPEANVGRFDDTSIKQSQRFTVEKAPKGEEGHYKKKESYSTDELKFLEDQPSD